MFNFLSNINIQEIVSVVPFKDITVNAVGGFLGSAFLLWIALGWSGIKSIKSKIRRPSMKIETRRAPENIFAAVELESSAAWIQQQLGHPNKIRGKWWGYRFSDAIVSLQFDSDMALETLSVALIDDNSTFVFPTIHFSCPPLGRAMLSDVLVEHLQLEYNHSLRHSELLVSGREGPTGA
jgi:hypothetical protein